MKPTVLVATSLLALSVLAVSATAAPVTFDPADPGDSVECASTAVLVMERDALRQRGVSSALGTEKGTVALTDALFDDFAGPFVLQLALFGVNADGDTVILASDILSIDGSGGRYGLRAKSTGTPGIVEVTSLSLRASHSGDVASLTVKWELELPPGMELGVHFVPTGLGVMAALTDGSTPCGDGVGVTIQGLADLTD